MKWALSPPPLTGESELDTYLDQLYRSVMFGTIDSSKVVGAVDTSSAQTLTNKSVTNGTFSNQILSNMTVTGGTLTSPTINGTITGPAICVDANEVITKTDGLVSEKVAENYINSYIGKLQTTLNGKTTGPLKLSLITLPGWNMDLAAGRLSTDANRTLSVSVPSLPDDPQYVILCAGVIFNDSDVSPRRAYCLPSCSVNQVGGGTHAAPYLYISVKHIDCSTKTIVLSHGFVDSTVYSLFDSTDFDDTTNSRGYLLLGWLDITRTLTFTGITV